MHKKRPTVAVAGTCGLFQPISMDISPGLELDLLMGGVQLNPVPLQTDLCLTAIPLFMYIKKRWH